MIPIPKVALVGRPNVGKSTLFNRICGRRKAITDSRPGSTRDRNYAQTSWQGAAFELIDTGGLLLGTADPLLGPAVQQAKLAIAEADRVATRWIWRLKFKSWWHRSVSGNDMVEIPMVSIVRVQDGKIAEIWHHRDDQGVQEAFGIYKVYYVEGFLLGAVTVWIASRLLRRRS